MAETLPSFASLYAFVLVAETGSLTAAAERLNITQPAISKRIRALEAELGVALLRRGANAMQLTEAGRQFALSLAAGFSAIKQRTRCRICPAVLSRSVRIIPGRSDGSSQDWGGFARAIQIMRLR